jgi:hypothetical protein
MAESYFYGHLKPILDQFVTYHNQRSRGCSYSYAIRILEFYIKAKKQNQSVCLPSRTTHGIMAKDYFNEHVHSALNKFIEKYKDEKPLRLITKYVKDEKQPTLECKRKIMSLNSEIRELKNKTFGLYSIH